MITNNQVKYIQSLKQKKFRGIHHQFVAEGSRLVLDLIHSPYKVAELFALQPWISTNQDTLTSGNIPLSVLTEKEMERISMLSSPSPVLALVNIPVKRQLPLSFDKELVLMLDDIMDPGNLGTIIRIADWFGIYSLICSENMVDLYNPKVVQASMGSLARVNVMNANLGEFLQQHKGLVNVFGTFMTGEDIFYTELPSTGIIIIGNEANGISPEVAAHINTRLSIPSFASKTTRSSPESLNVAVATAVVCAEFRRRVNLKI